MTLVDCQNSVMEFLIDQTKVYLSRAMSKFSGSVRSKYKSTA